MASGNGRKSKSTKPTGEKPTREEMDKRIALIKEMILTNWGHKGEIKQFAYDEWGVTARTVENYLSRARREINDEIGLDDNEERALLSNIVSMRLRDDLRSPEAKVRHSAAKLLIYMHGLNAPIKIAPTTPDGTEAYRARLDELSEEELLLMRKMIGKSTPVTVDGIVEHRHEEEEENGRAHGNGEDVD